jgi:hypothetical protein
MQQSFFRPVSFQIKKPPSLGVVMSGSLQGFCLLTGDPVNRDPF